MLLPSTSVITEQPQYPRLSPLFYERLYMECSTLIFECRFHCDCSCGSWHSVIVLAGACQSMKTSHPVCKSLIFIIFHNLKEYQENNPYTGIDWHRIVQTQ